MELDHVVFEVVVTLKAVKEIQSAFIVEEGAIDDDRAIFLPGEDLVGLADHLIPSQTHGLGEDQITARDGFAGVIGVDDVGIGMVLGIGAAPGGFPRARHASHKD